MDSISQVIRECEELSKEAKKQIKLDSIQLTPEDIHKEKWIILQKHME